MKIHVVRAGIVLLLLLITTSVGATAPSSTLSWEQLAHLQIDARASNTPLFDARPQSLFGFVVPLERDQEGALTEFLLVPYFGACIHVPPPPPNQIVHVTLRTPVPDIATMDTVWVTGVFRWDIRDASYAVDHATLTKEEQTTWTSKLRALFLTLVCGGSVALGFLGPWAGRQLAPALVCFCVSCAAGMLLTVGAATLLAYPANVLAFVVGLCVAVFLAVFSRRAVHAEDRSATLLAVGVALHNYPECFLVCSLSYADTGMGTVLALAMLSHNFPLGLSLGLAFSSLARAKRWACAMLAGIVPPIVALGTYYAVRTYISTDGMRLLMAGAGGVLVGLAVCALVPHARTEGSWLRVGAGMACGIGLLAAALWLLSFFA